MENKKIIKKYLNKYFKNNYIEEKDIEFKSLVRILNKANIGGDVFVKEVKEMLDEILKLSKYNSDHDKILDNFGDIENVAKRFKQKYYR